MSIKERNPKISKNLVATFLKWLGISLLTILVGAIIFLSIPRVQNNLFGRLLKKWSLETNLSIQHKDFYVKWFHQILLTGFEIKDANDQLLCNIDHLEMHVNLLYLMWGKSVVISYLELVQGQLQLIKNKQEPNSNLQALLAFIAKNNSAYGSNTPRKGVIIEKALFKNLSLTIDDQNVPPVASGFDPYHIKAEGITAELAHLNYEDDILVGNLQHFTGYHLPQELGIHKLHTQFKVTPYTTILDNLNVETQYSYLKGNLQFSYEGIEALKIAPSEMELSADFEELKLASKELAYFIPYFQGHTTDYKIKGKIIGRLKDFLLEDFYVEFGENKSHLKGFARLQGLPNFNDTHFNFNLHKSCVYTTDLLPHLAQEHHDIFRKIQLCRIQSNISGKPNHFIAEGDFTTDVGKINANMEIKVDTTSHEIAYKGDINTEVFKVGRLLDIAGLQEVTMHAHIDGHGIHSETASFYLKTHVQKLGFQGYNYENIRTNGRFAKAFFKGIVTVEDPNLAVHLDAKVDWRKPQKEFCVKGLLSNISFDKLGFGYRPIHLSSELSIALHGTSWDDFTTDATFNRIQLDMEDKPLYLEGIHILNGRRKGTSTLTINSDLLDIEARGAIKYTALVHDVQAFINAYYQRLLTSESAVPSYTEQPYIFKYRLKLKDINPLLYLIAPNVYITPNTTLQGFFSQQEEVKFELHLPKVDSLVFGSNELQGSAWNFVALQTKDNKLITATSRLTAFKQQWRNYINTENFVLDINWINDQISFKNTIGNESTNLQLNLMGEATLKNSGAHLKLDDSVIRFGNDAWKLHPAGTVTMHNSYIRFHNILLSNEAQQVSLEGKWFSSTPQKLILGITNLELDNFSSLLNRKIGGLVQGTLLLTGTSKEPKFNSDINIHTITVGDLKVGDLYTTTAWDNDAKCMNVACQLKHAEEPTIHVTGLYNPISREQNLDLMAEFSDAQLAILEPFVGKVFSELKGKLDGRFYIQGPWKAPQIEGRGILKDVALRVSYLNALYNGDGIISCTKDKMEIEKLRLSDGQQGRADFRGYISHNYFKEFSLNLMGDLDKLKVLNTKYEDNEYFYGEGTVTGNIAFLGAIDNVKIKANATTEKGTSLVIPIRKYNKKVEQEGYIRFVDFKNDNRDEIEACPPIQLKGISLDMNLEITPDACAEIMLNGKEGDTIQSQGKGNLTIASDSAGSLSVTGNYELVEGTYNFAVYEIVRKKFRILEGSTITWIDKPYDGILHVKAAYDQRINLTPLLRAVQGQTQSTRTPRKYLVRVLLELEGVLSSPDIKYDIQFLEPIDNSDLQEAVHTFREKIATDTNYLKNQVFSLVILKSFFIDGRISLDNSNSTFQRSVGEFFSQQLNSWAAQLDENLEIETDIDLEELNQEKTTSLPIKISYSLLSGRLLVARKSKIDFAAGNEMDLANVLGDWSVEYGLTGDNRFKVKLHVDPSGLETATDVSKPIFGGISFAYVKSFNRWRQFFSHNHSHHPDKDSTK